ncbi:MAG: DUF4373 domain-containing protein [Clostridia bacterium]|nr:DUF4373 domain-containing protein [Clostridia bacterium]
MARPYKQGIDYFPLDVDIFKDRKFHKIKGRYGHTGVCVYLAVLSLVYKDRGYYLDYSDEEAVIYDIIDLLQGGRYTPKYDTILGAVADLVACGLFSGDHFKSKILTSERIQRHYYTATVEREKIEIDESIWMLSIPEMKKLSGRSPILQFFINREGNGVFRTNNPESQSNSTQSKVKENNITTTKITTTDAPCGASSNGDVENDKENHVETVENEPKTNDIPTLSTVEAFFNSHNINGNPKDFYTYNQKKNPTFKDWESYAEIWGNLEHRPKKVFQTRKRRVFGHLQIRLLLTWIDIWSFGNRWDMRKR